MGQKPLQSLWVADSPLRGYLQKWPTEFVFAVFGLKRRERLVAALPAQGGPVRVRPDAAVLVTRTAEVGACHGLSSLRIKSAADSERSKTRRNATIRAASLWGWRWACDAARCGASWGDPWRDGNRADMAHRYPGRRRRFPLTGPKQRQR